MARVYGSTVAMLAVDKMECDSLRRRGSCGCDAESDKAGRGGRVWIVGMGKRWCFRREFGDGRCVTASGKLQGYEGCRCCLAVSTEDLRQAFRRILTRAVGKVGGSKIGSKRKKKEDPVDV
jgi:hypothetical protein